jgi:nucleoside-diphosphate-sugar epimerase
MGVVDVRDVALAHVRALHNPAAAGQRFLLAAGERSILMTEVADLLTKTYKPLGYKLPSFHAGYKMLWFVSFFDNQVAMILDDVKCPKQFNSSKATKVLGINFISWEEATLEMAKSLIKFGIVPEKKK